SVVVLDAASGMPLAGARVAEVAAGGLRGPEACGRSSRIAGGGTLAHAGRRAETDVLGRAFLTGDLPSDDSAHCMPGAPCAVMRIEYALVVDKDGYVPFTRTGHWELDEDGRLPAVRTVRLIGPTAKVRDAEAALAIAMSNPDVSRFQEHVAAAKSAWF